MGSGTDMTADSESIKGVIITYRSIVLLGERGGGVDCVSPITAWNRGEKEKGENTGISNLAPPRRGKGGEDERGATLCENLFPSSWSKNVLGVEERDQRGGHVDRPNPLSCKERGKNTKSWSTTLSDRQRGRQKIGKKRSRDLEETR